MKKLFILGTTFVTMTFFTACSTSKTVKSGQWWDKEITIQVKPGWKWDTKGDAFKNAGLLIEKKINELKNAHKDYQDLADVKVKLDWSTSSNTVIVQNIESKKYDLGIASIAATMEGNQKQLQPIIQTKTNSFTFDPEWKIYKNNGSNRDADLKYIAAQQTKEFNAKYNNANQTWNNIVYTNFYDATKKVNFYRGMVWVYGENKFKVIKAWDNKDWVAFRDYGILHGKPTSGGKFKLQEQLFKKHFGNDAFTTLVEEIQKNPTKFKEGKAANIHDGEYSIAFDDEGSFAWTKRVKDNVIRYDATNPQILIVTDPLKYDIGSFRSDFDPRQGKLIGQAFVELIKEAEAKNGEAKVEALKVIYGPNVGYNDYALIVDRKAELDDAFNNVMKLND